MQWIPERNGIMLLWHICRYLDGNKMCVNLYVSTISLAAVEMERVPNPFSQQPEKPKKYSHQKASEKMLLLQFSGEMMKT